MLSVPFALPQRRSHCRRVRSLIFCFSLSLSSAHIPFDSTIFLHSSCFVFVVFASRRRRRSLASVCVRLRACCVPVPVRCACIYVLCSFFPSHTEYHMWELIHIVRFHLPPAIQRTDNVLRAFTRDQCKRHIQEISNKSIHNDEIILTLFFAVRYLFIYSFICAQYGN